MIKRCLSLFAILAILAPPGCGYRFVDPLPAKGYSLGSVRNTTPEPDLSLLLEDELRKEGDFRKGSDKRLSVVVTGLEESVETVSSDGNPLRQKLTLEVAWKVDGVPPSPGASGKEVVSQSYPYSSDATTLDWNRRAAMKLLAKIAARRVVEHLGDQR